MSAAPSHENMTLADFTAFRAFFATKQATLAQALAGEIGALSPNLRSAPPTAVLAVTHSYIDEFLDGVAQPDAVPATILNQFQPMIYEQGEIASLLAVIAAFRQQLLHYGLEALTQGIENAAVGTQALVRLADTLTLWIANTYHTYLRDGMHRQSSELRTARDRLDQSFLNTPLATIEWDANGTVTFWNPSAMRIFGWTAEEAIGQNIIALLVPDIALEHVQMIVNALLEGTATNSRNLNRTKDGRLITCQWHNALLRDEAGNVIGALSQTEDVTEQVRNEEERGELQQQVIAAQAAALRELSTPLIPLANGVVAMPLIGSIDTTRAQQVLEGLLTGVAEQHARIAILDITGVPIVDTQVANVLLQAAQAVRLLGAQVILTGIRPEVAQTLVGLGVDLRGIVTLSTLQSGITYAFNRSTNRA